MAARATAAEMLKLFGGAYPPGHDATSFLAFAAQADSEVDTWALPAVLSTSGTNEVALANRRAVFLVHKSIWLAAGGVMSGFPEPRDNASVLKEEIAQLAGGTTTDGWGTLDWIDEDA